MPYARQSPCAIEGDCMSTFSWSAFAFGMVGLIPVAFIYGAFEAHHNDR